MSSSLSFGVALSSTPDFKIAKHPKSRKLHAPRSSTNCSTSAPSQTNHLDNNPVASNLATSHQYHLLLISYQNPPLQYAWVLISKNLKIPELNLKPSSPVHNPFYQSRLYHKNPEHNLKPSFPVHNPFY